MNEDKIVSMRSKSAAHNYNVSAHPAERTIPIEANSALRTAIESVPGPVGAEHVATVNELYLALYHGEEKVRLFGARADTEPMADFLDRVLSKSLTLVQAENATVVGIILDLVQTATEHPLLQKHVWGELLYHLRSSVEVQSEINIVSKTMASLQAELDRARDREKEAVSAAMAVVTSLSDDAASYDGGTDTDTDGHLAPAGVEDVQ